MSSMPEGETMKRGIGRGFKLWEVKSPYRTSYSSTTTTTALTLRSALAWRPQISPLSCHLCTIAHTAAGRKISPWAVRNSIGGLLQLAGVTEAKPKKGRTGCFQIPPNKLLGIKFAPICSQKQ